MHFSASREMVSIVDKYFSLNRTTLRIVGLWPYQKSKLSQIQLFCCFGIVQSFIICQLTTFWTSKCTVDHIIKVFSVLIITLATVTIYYSFCINNKTIKYLIEQLQRIYNDLKDNNEIAIVDRYGNYAKRYTTAFAMLLFFAEIILIGSQFPYFMRIIMFTNESQSRRLQISTEYFIDQEKYYYIALIHINAVVLIELTIFVATGAMFMAFFQHACGMFKIASYRIKNTMEIYIRNVNQENKNLICKGLIYGVNIHQTAMMSSKYLLSKFETTFMFFIVFGVISLSLNIFRILSSNYMSVELSLAFITICSICAYMFLANLAGQAITDHYNLLFDTAYKVEWYITPLYIQKFILLLLLRGNKSFGLRVGKLFIASLPCFTTLANASLSYFIVIYSTQE